MYGVSGWNAAVLLLGFGLWIIVLAGMFFALYWVVRLAVTHALRARDREVRGGGTPPHPSSGGPATGEPPAPGAPPSPGAPPTGPPPS